MNYRNKLMNLSLIALAVFSACSDEVENGTHPGKGDQRLSFAVSMGGTNAWKPTAGTRAASGLGESTYELKPIEMEGKVNGKTVYLTAEVTDGFPGDNRPMTRGTQISETNKTDMETFALSAYTDATGTPDFMYNETVTLNKDEGRWYPTGTYFFSLSKDRKKKIGDRITKTFQKFDSLLNTVSYDVAAHYLFDALHVLTCNVNLFNAKRGVKVGIFYSNQLLDNARDLEGLDQYLQYRCSQISLGGKAGVDPAKQPQIEATLKKQLKQVSFVKGFAMPHKRYKVKKIRLQMIKQSWV